jgi:outer membrane protein insertion porin family
MKSIIQWCLSAGAIWPLLSRNNQTIKINDKFFLGGPLNIRGFDYHGVGPHSEGAALGGDCYWATGLHLYTPLPFLYHRENLMSYIRLHYFINAGNVFNIQSISKFSFFIKIIYCFFKLDSTQTFISQLSNATRLSCGLGVVLNLMNVARLELNYTLPLWTQIHDR